MINLKKLVIYGSQYSQKRGRRRRVRRVPGERRTKGAWLERLKDCKSYLFCNLSTIFQARYLTMGILPIYSIFQSSKNGTLYFNLSRTAPYINFFWGRFLRLCKWRKNFYPNLFNSTICSGILLLHTQYVVDKFVDNSLIRC